MAHVTHTAIEEALRLERARCRALVAHDLTTLDALASDDLVYVHSGGYRDTKESWLEPLRSGQFRYTRADSSNLEARQHGDTIFIFGVADHAAVRDGAAVEAEVLFTVAWAKRDGGWLFVLWHATPSAATAHRAKDVGR